MCNCLLVAAGLCLLAAAGSAVAAGAVAAVAGAEGAGSDHEHDHMKLASLSPARIDIGTGDVPAVQIACGLHHTGRFI